MVDPRVGVITQADYVPSVAAVKTWLDKQKPPPSASYHRKFLPEPEAENVSPEERARRVDMLKRVSGEIRKAAAARTVGDGKPKLKPVQDHDPDALLRSLEGMEAARKTEADPR